MARALLKSLRAAMIALSRLPIIGKVFGRYESAYQKWGERSWLPAAVQDARFDADASTRIELIRRSRYWERNSGIVQRLVDLFEQFTVGPNGLQMVPDSTDENWNESASAWWKQWCRFPDLVSLQTAQVLQSLNARSWFVDGEAFIYKTYSNETGRPRVQLIESHRVATPPGKKDRTDIIDGVQVDAKGRPIGYWVSSGSIEGYSQNMGTTTIGLSPSAQDQYTFVPAEQMIHLFEPSRPGQYRGLPFTYAVMNDLHDLEDLQILEMKAAKAAAEVTNVITTQSGEAPSATGLRRQFAQIQSQDAAGNPVVKQDPLFYQVTLGGRTVCLKKGEDLKQFLSNRPSVAVREYWDYITAKICAGVGISRLLVFPFSMQGTVTRADLDVASAFFRSRSAVIANAWTEIYLWVIGWAVKYDRALNGAPKDGSWIRVKVRPPRAVNVDVGRNSSAMLDELEAGTRTFQDIYAEMGEDWREQLRQKAQERAYIRKLAKEFSTDGIELTPDEIASTAMPAPQKGAAQTADKGGATSPALTATP